MSMLMSWNLKKKFNMYGKRVMTEIYRKWWHLTCLPSKKKNITRVGFHLTPLQSRLITICVCLS